MKLLLDFSLFVAAASILLTQPFVKNMGDKLLEQRINIRYAMKLEKNATDIYKILQHVYGEGTMSIV